MRICWKAFWPGLLQKLVTITANLPAGGWRDSSMDMNIFHAGVRTWVQVSASTSNNATRDCVCFCVPYFRDREEDRETAGCYHSPGFGDRPWLQEIKQSVIQQDTWHLPLTSVHVHLHSTYMSTHIISCTHTHTHTHSSYGNDWCGVKETRDPAMKHNLPPLMIWN